GQAPFTMHRGCIMNRKSLPLIESLDRRRFMQRAGLWLGAAATPALQLALEESVFGKAHAQNAPPPTYFVEVNYRDQVDLGQVFVAPGLATFTNLVRGDTGDRCAMYVQQADLSARANNVWLTP